MTPDMSLSEVSNAHVRSGTQKHLQLFYIKMSARIYKSRTFE